jgi:hypothetical protein
MPPALEQAKAPDRRRPMRTIGVLGGMSNQAAAEYYRMINEGVNARLGGWSSAEMIIWLPRWSWPSRREPISPHAADRISFEPTCR